MGKEFSNSVKIKYPPSETKLIELLSENKTKLVNAVDDIVRIILFGSYARNKPHFGSDVDLVFVVEEKKPDYFEKIYSLLYDISLDYEWSPYLIEKEEFDQRIKEKDHFIMGILKTGRVIWEKK